MRQQTTDFGLSCLGQVPWGTHVCYFYNDATEALEVVVPYLAAGLRQEEACVWVCSTRDEAARAMQAMEAAVDSPRRLTNGQMQVLTYDKWYLGRDGGFDADRVLKQWSERMKTAVSAGYRGLRVVGDTSWLDESLWTEFSEYEARLYGSVGHDPMLALCLYPRCGDWLPDPVEVAKSHQYALVWRDSAPYAVECGRHWDTMWASLLDGLSDGLLIVDGTGAIRVANSGLLEMFAVPSLHDLGVDLYQFSRRFSFCQDAEIQSLDLSTILASDCGGRQYWKAISPTAGGQVYLSVRVRQMPSSPLSSRRFAVVFEDVTEARKTAFAKERLLHVMSHEFRNPLQIVRNVVSLLGDSKNESSLPRYLKTLATHGSSQSWESRSSLYPTPIWR